MLTSGDVQLADLGAPQGHEAGFGRPVVIVTAQAVLERGTSVIFAVPLSTRLRAFRSEVVLVPDEGNGLRRSSAAQCQHLRAISVARLDEPVGNVGPRALAQIRETIGDLLDL